MIEKNTIQEVKEYLHANGFTILDVTETKDLPIDDKNGVYYLDVILKNGNLETQKISTDDIVMAYIKAVETLNYNVKFIYDSPERTERDKILITQKVKKSYDIFVEKKSKEKESEIAQIPKENKLTEKMKAEFEKNYVVIDHLIERIEYLLNTYADEISEDVKDKLMELHDNELRQVKSIMNISRLRLIGEMASLKIGEAAIELIHKNKIKEKKEILKEINKSLSELKSPKKVVLPEDDLKLKLEALFNDIIGSVQRFFQSKKKKKEIDHTHGRYYEILRLQNVYKKKLDLVNRALL